jgi:uncharacterized membrane protein YoaK (UPF0700 family)
MLVPVKTSTASTLPSAVRRTRALRERARLVIVLAVTSGATDAIGFLALGSAFTSVMTGNMVLLGVGAADRDVALLLSCTVAIVSFVVGAAIGARVAGAAQAGDPVWPRAVSRALWIEVALLAAFAAAWWSLGSSPEASWLLPMLGLNAGALGLQSSAIQRFGVSGLSTTYLTGTLTTIVIRLSSGHGLRDVGHSLLILLGLVVGAAVGALLIDLAPPAVPAVQLLTVLAVLVAVRFSRHLAVPVSSAS